jgi:hypothetical protein
MKVNKKTETVTFLKAYYGFSYLLSPEEERIIKHLKEIDYIGSIGFNSLYSRAGYARIMGLSVFAFDRCAKSLCRMGLLVKTENSNRNRVQYRINGPAYHRLVRIVSVNRNSDRLKQFFDFHILQLGKTIEEVTDEEIKQLSI